MPKGTRENIINAFFSLASKHPSSTHFTLTQIAKEAGISRQSIYQNHFNNYDELIQYIHEMIDADIHSHIEQDLTTKDPITLFGDNIIPLLYSKRTWLRCLYTTEADPSWRSFLQITYGKWIKENMSPTKVDLQMPKPFLQELFSSISLTSSNCGFLKNFQHHLTSSKNSLFYSLRLPILSSCPSITIANLKKQKQLETKVSSCFLVITLNIFTTTVIGYTRDYSYFCCHSKSKQGFITGLTSFWKLRF